MKYLLQMEIYARTLVRVEIGILKEKKFKFLADQWKTRLLKRSQSDYFPPLQEMTVDKLLT